MSIPSWHVIVADLFGVIYGSDCCKVLGIITYFNKQGIGENRYIEIDLSCDSLFMKVTICYVIRHFECVQFRASLDRRNDRLLLCDQTNAVERFEEFFGGNGNE